ncbi:Bro-N domain-containing protein [Pseudomonas granadensis]|uniref:BRO-N domain-containing protein n=1 Tax=Pseudomonas granadensis TaxID=1421430 RepID=UPI003AEF8EBB
MGIESDVLVGHPEHELLFVATQVARAAGLKNPSNSVANYHRGNTDLPGMIAWDYVRKVYHALIDPNDVGCNYHTVRHLQARSWMFSESTVYSMLLKGQAPQSEPFRKWGTEEVLPTIRKTGKYDAEQSSNSKRRINRTIYSIQHL